MITCDQGTSHGQPHGKSNLDAGRVSTLSTSLVSFEAFAVGVRYDA
jgi:hypothetical protein